MAHSFTARAEAVESPVRMSRVHAQLGRQVLMKILRQLIVKITLTDIFNKALDS
jgi:hypothetical protein